MTNSSANQRHAPLSGGRPFSTAQPVGSVALAGDVDLILLSARVLFSNGQTTERTVVAVEQLAEALGLRVTVFPRWGELILCIDSDTGSRYEIIAAAPLGVDMSKVAATMSVIDKVCAGRMDIEATRSALQAVTRFPPVSLARFALMTGAGAAALGVIFGAAHAHTLILIALSAGAGACLRRWLAGISRNAFVQPFSAALLAGVVGAVAARVELSSVLHLVAVCPCMVLIPGPHLLNGTIDLARARVALGASRIGYASLIILMICMGLLLGLSFGAVNLPVSGPSYPVSLKYDVIAAGVAVAAYSTFFAMPWRMVPIPVVIGMLAHAARWATISVAGASVETGALVACLVVGTIVSPIADRLRLPFAAFAFASVVSLLPGVFLFRMAGGFVSLSARAGSASPELLVHTIADGTTAFLIILAMTFGLIVPRMWIKHFQRSLAKLNPRGSSECIL
jgi:uncharacterized membrane protein YjjP (DUF1212 family)